MLHAPLISRPSHTLYNYLSVFAFAHAYTSATTPGSRKLYSYSIAVVKMFLVSANSDIPMMTFKG